MNEAQLTKFPLITRISHWLVALLVIGLFALGFWMVELDYYSDWYHRAPWYHKSFGLLLFFMLCAWLLVRLKLKSPGPLATHAKWQIQSAKLVKITMLSCVIILSLTGYLIVSAAGDPIEFFVLFEIPGFGSIVEYQEDIAGSIHKWVAYLLIAVVVMHAGAALKHHFIDKDLTLKRML
jgi:cytochrome b561